MIIKNYFRKPDDWTLSWGGSGQIWVWGHNHRGQLGGVEGAKVKLPLGCEALASLRPVQLIGGEQTLFAVTADGKVSLSGYLSNQILKVKSNYMSTFYLNFFNGIQKNINVDLKYTLDTQ